MAVDLLSGLRGYWKLDETSGTRADSSGNGHHLEDVNSTGFAVGKQGNAADFTFAGEESLQVASTSELQAEGFLTIGCWFLMTTTQVTEMELIQKYSGFGSNKREYRLSLGPVSGEFEFTVSANGSGAPFGQVTSDGFGSPAFGVWAFVLAWHNPDSDYLNISINNGTPDSVAYTQGIHRDDSDFEIGALRNANFFSQCRIDEVGMWDRALNEDEKAWLYNSGAGRTYPFGASDDGGHGGEGAAGGGVPQFRAYNMPGYKGAISGNYWRINNHLKITRNTAGAHYVTVVYREVPN